MDTLRGHPHRVGASAAEELARTAEVAVEQVRTAAGVEAQTVVGAEEILAAEFASVEARAATAEQHKPVAVEE